MLQAVAKENEEMQKQRLVEAKEVRYLLVLVYRMLGCNLQRMELLRLKIKQRFSKQPMGGIRISL